MQFQLDGDQASFRLRDQVRSLVEYRFLASCWVIVLAPWTIRISRRPVL